MLIVDSHFSVRLRINMRIFSMDFPTILVITFISSLSLYFIFLLIGVGGISRNRKAQGIDQKLNK